MKVVSVINHKGGVGRTTLTANFGAGLAVRGKRVLLVDLDSQASLTVSLVKETEWQDAILPRRTVKHWFDGLGTGTAMRRMSQLISSPRAVIPILAPTGGYRRAVHVLGKLTDGQQAELGAGRAQLVFSSGSTVVAARASRSRAAAAAAKPKLDVDGAVTAIRRLPGAGEVEAYPDANDKQLTAAALKEIAKRLGPTVTAGGKNKAEIKRNIVRGTPGFRQRSAAMSGGAWN